MIGFLIKNWRYIAPAAVVLLFLLGLWVYGSVKYHEGYQDAVTKVKLEAATKAEKRNEIANNPASRDELHERLRLSSY